MSKARDLANAGTALGAVTATELGYVDGVTSAIQTQIDSKIGSASAINPTIVDAKGDIIAATAADTVARLAVGSNDAVLTADSSTATGLKWAAVAGGYANYQTFTSSTTWTVPTGITKCAVYLLGGGGGGASGRIGPSGFTTTGGSGGAGGIIGFEPFYTVTPGASVTVTIGAGGAGGALRSSTTNYVDGLDGASGSQTVFGALIANGCPGGNRADGTSPKLGGISAFNGTANTISIRETGNGGSSLDASVGGTGGNGILSILNTAGTTGSAGSTAPAGTTKGAGGTSTPAGFGGGGGGGGGTSGSATAYAGGTGVNGGGGGGGNAVSATNVTTTSGGGGNAGANTGAGGGGSGSAYKEGSGGATVTASAGGNGGSGFVAIFY